MLMFVKINFEELNILKFISATNEEFFSYVRVNYTLTYRITANSELSERYLLDPHVNLDISGDVFQQMQNESDLSSLLINTEDHRKLELEHKFHEMCCSEQNCIIPRVFDPFLRLYTILMQRVHNCYCLEKKRYLSGRWLFGRFRNL